MQPTVKPRVVYWNYGPSPYVTERLSAVARRGNVRIEAWFNVAKIAWRSWDLKQEQWTFPARLVKSGTLAGSKLQIGSHELKETAPDLVVCGYDMASRALGALAASATGARIAFRVLPSFGAWFKPSARRELAKHFLFRVADGVKVSGKMAADTAIRYGMIPDRVRIVRQSIDRDHYAQAIGMRSSVRDACRRELGLRGVVFIYVGRLWSKKGIDYLFDAYREMVKGSVDASLLIIGDGPDEARYRKLARDLRNVVFAGFVQRHNLPRYYSAADVMVFPTLGDPFGLVVEEAMAAGLPVICTEAAGEIRDRLPDGKAGYIVPPADSAALTRRMFALATEPRLRRTMSEIAQNAASIASHDSYARDFENFVEAIVRKPRRASLSAHLGRATGRAVMALDSSPGGKPASSSRVLSMILDRRRTIRSPD